MYFAWFRWSLAAAVLLGLAPLLVFSYDIKDLQIRSASEYEFHQDFQQVVIGAYPYDTLQKTLEIFDTKKLHEKGFMPILLVFENNNTFPIRLAERDIFLIDPTGKRTPPTYYVDVLLEISLKDKTPRYSSNKKLLLEKAVKKEMLLDFEHKSLGEKKVIAPMSSDHGVVFFRLPEEDKLDGYMLYFPEIFNFSTDEPLVFFEFELR